MNASLTITHRLFTTGSQSKAVAPTRYEVGTGETLTLRPENQLMRIVSGSAWVSWKAINIPLEKGGRWIFTQDEFPAVILAQGNTPLIFELYTIPAMTSE